MSINLISTPSVIKVGPRKGETMYTTRVAHYSTIDAEAVIDYASEIGLLPRGILRAAWDVLGDVIQQLVLHGHIVQIPGVGNIRAEVRAKAQTLAEDVSPECVTHRKLMLTPNTKLRSALKHTPMTVTVIEEPEEPIAPELPKEQEPHTDLSTDSIAPEPQSPPTSSMPTESVPEPSAAPAKSPAQQSLPRSARRETEGTILTTLVSQNKPASPASLPIVPPTAVPSSSDSTLLNKSPPFFY